MNSFRMNMMNFLKDKTELDQNTDYKKALKFFLQVQIQSLCLQLSSVGEELIVITANVPDGTYNYLGSCKGEDFLQQRVEIQREFLDFCSDGDSETATSVTESEYKQNSPGLSSIKGLSNTKWKTGTTPQKQQDQRYFHSEGSTVSLEEGEHCKKLQNETVLQNKGKENSCMDSTGNIVGEIHKHIPPASHSSVENDKNKENGIKTGPERSLRSCHIDTNYCDGNQLQTIESRQRVAPFHLSVNKSGNQLHTGARVDAPSVTEELQHSIMQNVDFSGVVCKQEPDDSCDEPFERDEEKEENQQMMSDVGSNSVVSVGCSRQGGYYGNENKLSTSKTLSGRELDLGGTGSQIIDHSIIGQGGGIYVPSAFMSESFYSDTGASGKMKHSDNQSKTDQQSSSYNQTSDKASPMSCVDLTEDAEPDKMEETLTYENEGSQQFVKIPTQSDHQLGVELGYRIEIDNQYFDSDILWDSSARLAFRGQPYTCSVCGQGFTMKETLRRHERRHNNDRPFRCNFCNKTFTRSDYLMKHARQHTGVYPFSCRTCGVCFHDNLSLRKHIATPSHISKTKRQSHS